MKSKENSVLQNLEFATKEEVELIKEEYNKVDILKKKLMQTKSQTKRQEILQGFEYEFKTIDAQNRMNFIEEKVNREVPGIVRISKIMGFGALLALLLIFVVSFLISFSIIDNQFMAIAGTILGLVFWVCLITWIVQKIMIFVKSLSKDYYLNLKDI